MTPIRISAAIALALCMAVTGPALQASEPVAEAQAKAAAPVKTEAAAKAEAVAQTSDAPARDPNKRVCKNAQPTGTRLGKRTCKTQAQWDEIEHASRDTVQRAQQQSTMTNMAGGQG